MKQQYKENIFKMVERIDNERLLKKIYTFIRNLIKFSRWKRE